MKRNGSCWDGKVDEHLGRRSISAGDVVRKRGRIGGETYVFGLLEEGADKDHWVVTWEGEEEGSETFGTHRAESLRIKGRADASTKAYLKRIRPPLKEENSAEGAPPPAAAATEEEDAPLPEPPSAAEKAEEEEVEVPVEEEAVVRPPEPPPAAAAPPEPERRFASTKAARYYSAIARSSFEKPAPTEVGQLQPPAASSEPISEAAAAALPEDVLRIDDDIQKARELLRPVAPADA